MGRTSQNVGNRATVSRKNNHSDRTTLKPVVIARLTGGLGNQMFQYAAARTLADESGLPLILDARRLDVPGMRAFGLDAFRIRFDELVRANPVDERRTRLGRRLQMRQVARTEPPKIGPARDVFEQAEAPALNDLESVRLVGFWQSPTYFAKNAQIHTDFRLSHTVESSLAFKVPDRPYAVMHVRRGDYLHPKNRDRHPTIGIEYYRQAIRRIKALDPNVEVYAVSDDHHWVERQSLPVRMIGGTHALEDFNVMTKADYVVCANSTFSWWAGWLSQARQLYVPEFWKPLAVDSARLDPRWVLVDDCSRGS